VGDDHKKGRNYESNLNEPRNSGTLWKQWCSLIGRATRGYANNKIEEKRKGHESKGKEGKQKEGGHRAKSETRKDHYALSRNRGTTTGGQKRKKVTPEKRREEKDDTKIP